MTNLKPKAYSYVRFSSAQQAKGDSFRRQTELATTYAERNGLELATAKEYTFFDLGKSALLGKNLDAEGQLRRFYDLVESGEIAPGSYLLVESLDRLSREKVQKALPRFIDLLNKGVHVVTLSDGKFYRGGDDVDPADILISLVMMMRAHEESATKGDRVSARWQQKQKEARESGKALGKLGPAWLRLDGEGKYAPIPERVETIKRIFTLAAGGGGAAAISAQLNQEQVPTFGRSSAWGAVSVRKLLSYRALLGEYQPFDRRGGKEEPKGEAITGFYPSVIDEATFYQVQGLIALRSTTKATKQSTTINLWQGVAKCHECGSAMHLVNKGKPPKGNTYLICYTARNGGCSAKAIRLEQADAIMPELLAQVDALALVSDSSQALNQAISESDGRLAEVRTKLATVAELHAEFPSRTTAQQLSELEALADTLEQRKEQARAALATGDLMPKADFISKLDLVTVEGRRAANTLLKRLGLTAHFQRIDLKKFHAVVMDDSTVTVGHVDHHICTVFYDQESVTSVTMRKDSVEREWQRGEMTDQEYWDASQDAL